MQAFSSKDVIGCIGKCTSGLSRAQLDKITDNINNTLADSKGREIFEKYLKKQRLTDNLECLALYEHCHELIVAETKSSPSNREDRLEFLIQNVENVKAEIELLESEQMDLEFLRSIGDVNDKSREALIDILEETKKRCCNHLVRVHDSFKAYATQPCPLNNTKSCV